MSEHEAVYLGQPATRFESMCSCGWRALRHTSYEASEAWYAHKIEKHNEADAAERERRSGARP